MLKISPSLLYLFISFSKVIHTWLVGKASKRYINAYESSIKFTNYVQNAELCLAYGMLMQFAKLHFNFIGYWVPRRVEQVVAFRCKQIVFYRALIFFTTSTVHIDNNILKTFALYLQLMKCYTNVIFMVLLGIW